MIQLIPLLPLSPQPPIQEPILRIRHPRKEQCNRYQSSNGIPSMGVVRCILALKQLTTDDTRQVGAHDHNSEGNGSFFGGFGVEGDPGGVNGVYIGGRLVWGEIRVREGRRTRTPTRRECNHNNQKRQSHLLVIHIDALSVGNSKCKESKQHSRNDRSTTVPFITKGHPDIVSISVKYQSVEYKSKLTRHNRKTSSSATARTPPQSKVRWPGVYRIPWP